MASQLAEISGRDAVWAPEPGVLAATLEKVATEAATGNRRPGAGVRGPTAVVLVAGEGSWHHREGLGPVEGLNILPVTVDCPAVTIGPLVGADRGSGCYECWQRRQLQRYIGTDPERIEVGGVEVVGDAQPLRPLRGVAPSQARLVMALVDAFSSRLPSTEVVAYNLLTNRTAAHRVLPVVGCRTCGGRP